ncbi:MAG: serpin family protein [Candidatus Omnitrophica bacterium]|nr:serpin family protein [Candidatus Omnitrophota bacterium]
MRHSISNKAVILIVSLLFVSVSVLGILCVSALGKTNKEVVVEGVNDFAFDLYAELKKEKGNIFLSPLSISTALTMTYAGSAGKTAEQMAAALHLPQTGEMLHATYSELLGGLNVDEKSRGYSLTLANALWGQAGYKFKDEFKRVMDRYYDAGFKELNFKEEEKARGTINAWVEEITREKIKDLIPKGLLTPLTRLVLTNAIYFKGDWASQFDKNLTKEGDFLLLDGKKSVAHMMHKNEDLRYAERESVKMVELPYAGNRLSMLIVLPKKNDGITEIEGMLTLSLLEEWIDNMSVKKVLLSMPRFKMESEFFLGRTLQSLGMTDAFDAQSADFTGITAVPEEFFIDEVIHKSFVDVNEEGTEAAAATGVVMKTLSMPEERVIFTADHPFIFFIRDNVSGSILFIGRVADPS